MRLARRDLSQGGLLPDCADLRTRLPTGCWMVEAGGQPPDWHLPCPASSSLAVSLQSATVMATELGLVLTSRLLLEGCVPQPLASLALHEMIVNAVVHGNLGVSSGSAARWDDLTLRQHLIEQALEDPAKAQRVVTVAAGWDGARIVVTVSDEGDGYVPLPEAAGPAGKRASGRGLSIARAAGQVRVAWDGRCTQLVMACAGQTVPG